MARIIIHHLRGKAAGTREIYPASRFDSLFIGRDAASDILFDEHEDDLVSRSHAVIEWEHDIANTLTLTDLLSSNGTYLNGARILASTRLRSGDVIDLGKGGPRLQIELAGPKSLSFEADVTGPNRERPLVKNTRPMRAVPDTRDRAYEKTRRP